MKIITETDVETRANTGTEKHQFSFDKKTKLVLVEMVVRSCKVLVPNTPSNNWVFIRISLSLSLFPSFRKLYRQVFSNFRVRLVKLSTVYILLKKKKIKKMKTRVALLKKQNQKSKLSRLSRTEVSENGD
jgi:hypothetical protein